MATVIKDNLHVIVNPVTSNGGKINSVSANISDLTASRAVVTDASKNLVSSATTATELGYVNGVTSSIQTQLNGKEPTLTKGDLTASGAISLDQTRQVIGGAAAISHSDEAGYKHVPTGGATGQFLKYGGASGTPAWAAHGLTAADVGALSGYGLKNYIAKFNAITEVQMSLIYEDDDGNVGIGTATPAAKLQIAGIPSTAFGIIAGNDITNGGMTNNTRKYLRIGCPSYDIDEEPVSIITADNNGSANILHIGGGTGAGNATTEIRLKTDVLNTTTGTDRVVIKSDGKVGIGTDTPTARLDVCEGGGDARISLVIGADANASPRTDSHNKHARMGCPHYDLDEEVSSILFCSNTSTENRLCWGGGSSLMNSATSHQFYTSASNTITTGTERVRIQSDGKVAIGMTAPATAVLDVNSDIIRLRTPKTPANSTAAGNAGDICWDTNYLYVCYATNSWGRIALLQTGW
jgi:hypothetical protein